MSVEKFEKIESAIKLAQESGVTNEQLMEFLAAKMEELNNRSKVFENVDVAGEENKDKLVGIDHEAKEVVFEAEKEVNKVVSPEEPEKETKIKDLEDFKVYVKNLEDEAETDFIMKKQVLFDEITQRNLNIENPDIVPEDQINDYARITKEKETQSHLLDNFTEQYNNNPYLIISTVVDRYFLNQDFSNKNFMTRAVTSFFDDNRLPKKVDLADKKPGAMKKVFKKIAEEFKNTGLISEKVYLEVDDYLNKNSDL